MLSSESLAKIDLEIGNYPAEHKEAAVMATLRIVQEEQGWLSGETIRDIATYLEIPPIRAYEVATFYSMYELEETGRHRIEVCTNISCMLRGSDGVVSHIEERLGIKVGETTADGRYTLREVECLGACVGAPMMQVGNGYYEKLTTESIDAILDGLE